MVEEPTVQTQIGEYTSLTPCFLTLPRFYRHLHKGENGEIGGDHVSKHSTSVYRGM